MGIALGAKTIASSFNELRGRSNRRAGLSDIQTISNEWLINKRQLHESYFAGLGSAGDKGPVALPEKYVVIQPYSTNARKVYRGEVPCRTEAERAALNRSKPGSSSYARRSSMSTG